MKRKGRAKYSKIYPAKVRKLFPLLSFSPFFPPLPSFFFLYVLPYIPFKINLWADSVVNPDSVVRTNKG